MIGGSSEPFRQTVVVILAYLSALPPVPNEREVSFRLLLHYLTSVSHQKYHGVDIVTVRVESTR